MKHLYCLFDKSSEEWINFFTAGSDDTARRQIYDWFDKMYEQSRHFVHTDYELYDVCLVSQTSDKIIDITYEEPVSLDGYHVVSYPFAKEVK